MTRLPAERRELLQQVAQAAFCNPFSRERDEIDYRIAAHGGISVRVSNDQLMASVKGVVARAVADLARGGSAAVAALAEPDRQLARTSLLFHFFHRYEQALDQHIEAQAAAGDQPAAVPFAGELLASLTECGFSAAEADRYVGIFYQLRRAYFFIGRGLTGAAPCMTALRRHLWTNVFTVSSAWYERYLCQRMEDFSTLLYGETGTGKGTVAAALGRSGFIPFDGEKRKFKESFTRAFVAINLSQYPATLIESELFGHRKGAFTGAAENHAGVFARCSPHGAIFIDEVGDVAPQMQVKLLGVLQERQFNAVGSHEKQRFSGRVIAATNKDVAAMRREGAFRDDFFYRLCSDVITVPTLRQRVAENVDELNGLLGSLLAAYVGEAPGELVGRVREMLERGLPKGYGWPGNVRELEQAVRRVLVTGVYRGDDRAGVAAAAAAMTTATGGKPRTAQEVLSEHCRRLYAELGTYEDVARVAGLDRRTAKKYING